MMSTAASSARQPAELLASPQTIVTGPLPSPEGVISKSQQAPDAEEDGDPVRVDDGTLQYSFTDIESDGFGSAWGQTRSWTNNPLYAVDEHNGNGWVNLDRPKLVEPVGFSGPVEIILGGATVATFFPLPAAPPDPVHPDFWSPPPISRPSPPAAGDGSDGNPGAIMIPPSPANNIPTAGLPPKYAQWVGSHSILVYHPDTDEYLWTDQDGNQTKFYGFNSSLPTLEAGTFESYQPTAGSLISAYSHDSNGNVTEIRRSETVGAATTIESFVYSYFGSGNNIGELKNVTLRRSMDSGTNWSTVRQVEYTYYDGSYSGENSYGNFNDLRTAAVEDSNGTPISTSYYRYYTSNDSNGNGTFGELKYEFTPEAYARLSASLPSGTTPFTATNAQVSPFATLSLEYNQIRSVSKVISGTITSVQMNEVTNETVAGAGSTSGTNGGLGTWSFNYYENTSSAGTINTWAYKTTITKPDGTTDIIYSNYAGQSLLNIQQNGVGHQWMTENKYDQFGFKILTAEPSAITGYSESNPDLNITLSDHSGEIHIFQNQAGYRISEGIREGRLGSLLPLKTISYANRTVGDTTVLKVDEIIEYPNSDGFQQRITDYAYTWFSNSFQPATITIHSPAISVDHNGHGAPDTEVDVFDIDGNLIWRKDPDGFLASFTYDIATGAMTRSITDVNTSLSSTPSGSPGSTPTGGGLNLQTTVVVDPLGRPIEMTDPKGTITYYAYDDENHEYRVYPGWYQIGGSGTYTTTDPVQVYHQDWGRAYKETLTYSNTFYQSVPDGSDAIVNLQTLDRQYENSAGQLIADESFFNFSGLTYAADPIGTLNANYYLTSYGYDIFGRQNEVVAPTGTITKNTYDFLDRLVETQIGTDESNLTDVADYQYDNGNVGDGNLTQLIVHPDADSSDDRITDYYYDSRDRRVGELDGADSDGTGITGAIIHAIIYDNLDEPVSLAQFAGTGLTPTDADFANSTVDEASGLPNEFDSSLARKVELRYYDDQGRVYQDTTVGYDEAANGGSSLTTLNFYDNRGDLIATQVPGGLWTKYVYDGAGRLASQSQTDAVQWASDLNDVETNGVILPDDSLYNDATTVTHDHVLSQTKYQYDGNGNLIFTITADRLNTDPTDDDQGLGALKGPTATDGLAARVSYQAYYYDAADRLVDSVDIGTNGGTTLSAPPQQPGIWIYPPPGLGPQIVYQSSPPAGSLWTHYTYDAAGWNDSMTDPRGIVTAYTHDPLNRLTRTIADFGTSASSVNQTTTYTYDGDNHLLSQTAVMPAGTPSQTTTYIYGVTKAQGSAINSNDLLYQTQYPVLYTGEPVETYKYDALGETASYSDRNGTTHQYGYDSLGRLVSDYLSTVGSGVDGTVHKLGYSYDDAGRLQYATSYNAGNSPLNQVKETYDGLGQVTSDVQSHSGAVTASTPVVSYGYGWQASRPDTMTYADGRQINYNYDYGMDDRISRLSGISDGSGAIQSYQYLGLDTPMQVADGNGIQLNITFDAFGRISDENWTTSFTGMGPQIRPSIDDSQYGYDPDGNITYKLNGVSGAASQSELYGYDHLNRLTSFARGTLNTGHTAISGMASATQSWILDAVGNPTSVNTNGAAADRQINPQNEAQTIDGRTQDFDPDGNKVNNESDGGYTDGYVYDGWNRLVTVYLADATHISTYRYDALGRRITETRGGTTTDLYYSTSGQVIEERQGGATTAQYIWSPFYVNELVERDDQPDASGNLTRRVYAEHDANYNISSLTDGSGYVVERFEYLPYGTQTVLSSGWAATTDACNWVYGFQGGRTDPATGLIHFNARDYDPATGRWMQQDPAGYINGSNLYQFVESNPVKFVDPTGLQAAPPPAEPDEPDPKNEERPDEPEGDPSAGWRRLSGQEAMDHLEDLKNEEEYNARRSAEAEAKAAAAADAARAARLAPENAAIDRQLEDVAKLRDLDDIKQYNSPRWPDGQRDDHCPDDQSGHDPENELNNADPEQPPAEKGLPTNPDDLLKEGYVETSHPNAAAAGHRTFENPTTGDKVRFDKGDSGAPGHAGNDHYHRDNPNSTGKGDQYLDKNGNPVPRGSDLSHLYPG